MVVLHLPHEARSGFPSLSPLTKRRACCVGLAPPQPSKGWSYCHVPKCLMELFKALPQVTLPISPEV